MSLVGYLVIFVLTYLGFECIRHGLRIWKRHLFVGSLSLFLLGLFLLFPLAALIVDCLGCSTPLTPR